MYSLRIRSFEVFGPDNKAIARININDDSSNAQKVELTIKCNSGDVDWLQMIEVLNEAITKMHGDANGAI